MISKNAKGLTLVEILIAMMLLSFVVVVGNRVIMMFARSGAQNINDYNIQNAARVSASTMKTSINNASTLFLLTESAFKPDKLTSTWHYVGVERVGNFDEVVHYIYNEARGEHDRIVLGKTGDGERIDLKLKKLETGDRKVVVTFSIIDKNGRKSVLIDTTFETMNTFNFVDWTSGAGARAYAYRTSVNEIIGERGIVTKDALIGFTIDRSGSMRWGMEDNTDTDRAIKEHRPIHERRTYILREAITKFIVSMSDNEKTYIVANSFANNASRRVRRPRSVDTELRELLQMFDPALYNPAQDRLDNSDYFLRPEGDTNAGDGLRILYHQMRPGYEKYSAAQDEIYYDPFGVDMDNMKKIYILVSDGDNNMVTLRGNRGKLDDYSMLHTGPEAALSTINSLSANVANNGEYYEPQWASVVYSIGAECPIQMVHGNNYAYMMAKYVKDNEPPDTTFYAIALDDVEFFGELAEVWGYGKPGTAEYAKHIFKARDVDALDAAFKSVAESIKMDLSYFHGPER